MDIASGLVGVIAACEAVIYLYDGPNLVEEVDSSGSVLARYTQENEIDEPLAELRSGTTSYYEQDGQGSISSLSNSSGSLADTYTYNSFGNLTASTGSVVNPFQYTAREFDQETGLYFNRARYLDPANGRWLSEDPIRFLGGNDFYAYVLNNPLKYRDPLGKQSQMPSCYPDCARTPEEQQQIARENYEWNQRIFGPPSVLGPHPPSSECKCKSTKTKELTVERQLEAWAMAWRILDAAEQTGLGVGLAVGGVATTVYVCTETGGLGCTVAVGGIVPPLCGGRIRGNTVGRRRVRGNLR
jgi:RHS repeat-associated protein